MIEIDERLKLAHNWENDHNHGTGFPYDGFHGIAPEWVRYYREDVTDLVDRLEHARILALRDVEVRRDIEQELTALRARNERLQKAIQRFLQAKTKWDKQAGHPAASDWDWEEYLDSLENLQAAIKKD